LHGIVSFDRDIHSTLQGNDESGEEAGQVMGQTHADKLQMLQRELDHLVHN
jgi:hypothetical protein